MSDQHKREDIKMDPSDRRRGDREHDRRTRDRSLTPDMKRRRRYSRSRSRSRSRDRGRDRYDSMSPRGRDRNRENDRYDSDSPPRGGRDRRRYRSRSPSRDSRSRSRSRSLERDFGRRRRRDRGMRSRRRRDRKRRHDSRSRSPRHDGDGGDSRSPPRRRARREYSRSPRRGRDSRRVGRGPYFDDHQTHSLFVAALDNAAQRHKPPFNVSIVNDRMRQLDHTWDISNSDYKRFADLCHEMHRRRILEVARVRETICVVRFLTPPGRPLEGRPGIAPDFDRNSRRRDYDDYDRRRGRDDDRYHRGRDERRDDDRGYRGDRMRDDEMRRRNERPEPFDRRRDKDELMLDKSADVGDKGSGKVDVKKEAVDEASGAVGSNTKAAGKPDNEMEMTAAEVKKEQVPAVGGVQNLANSSAADGDKNPAVVEKDKPTVEDPAEDLIPTKEKVSEGTTEEAQPILEKTEAKVVNDDVMANHSAGDAKEQSIEAKKKDNLAEGEETNETEAKLIAKSELSIVENENNVSKEAAPAADVGSESRDIDNVTGLSNGDIGNTKPEANGASVPENNTEDPPNVDGKKHKATSEEGPREETKAQ